MQLRIIEDKLQQKERQKVEKIIKRQEDLKLHSEIVNYKHHQVREMSQTLNTELIQKDLQKMSKTIKNRVSNITVVTIITIKRICSSCGNFRRRR